MKWKKHPSPDELSEALEGMRPLERHTLGFTGLVPEQILELYTLFKKGDRGKISAALREGAGHFWAANAFESQWDSDPDAARSQGLFDLIWHRRALELDPFVTAHDFGGLDVLLQMSAEVSPRLGELLGHINGNDAENPRRVEGPDWWVAWHEATKSRAGGWLDAAEVKEIQKGWTELAAPEIEEACLQIMGVPYTHPGCWTLMEQLGGFFAQCASENRVVAVEVDL